MEIGIAGVLALWATRKLFEDSRLSEKLEAAKERNDSSPDKSNATLGLEESVTSPERERKRKDQLVEKLSRGYTAVR